MDDKKETHGEDCCCVRTRHEPRTEQEMKDLIHRLNRMEGQIRGIRGMVERNAYCTEIMVQVAAVNAALNAFNRQLLATHIRTCVADDIREGREDAVEDLLETMKKLMK